MAQTPKRRGTATARDMILSLIVLLGGVLLFVVLQPRSHGQKVRAVDYASQVDIARNQASYVVVAPAALPPGWQVNYARVSIENGVGLHLGLVKDASRFAQLDESDRPDAAFLADAHVPAGTAGTVSAGGQTYEIRRGDGHVALVRRLAGGALVSLSDGGGKSAASYDELVTLAGSLQDQPRGAAG